MRPCPVGSSGRRRSERLRQSRGPTGASSNGRRPSATPPGSPPASGSATRPPRGATSPRHPSTQQGVALLRRACWSSSAWCC
eukprot:2379923-Alexandrium_andersonii.AAC.1